MDLQNMELNLFGQMNDDPKDHFIHLPIAVLNNYTPGVIIKPPDIDNDRYLLSMNNTIFDWRNNITFPESVLKEMGWSKQKDAYIAHGKYNAEIIQMLGMGVIYTPKQELYGENKAAIVLSTDYLWHRYFPMHLSKDFNGGYQSIDLTKVDLSIRFSSIVEDAHINLSRDLIDKLELDESFNQCLDLY